MPSVIMLNVIKLNVVAPKENSHFEELIAIIKHIFVHLL
jgi:hypothetical protein